jgi:hypothetical protein
MMRDEEGCGGTKDHGGECASDAARQPGTVEVCGHAESPSVINSNLATPVWFQWYDNDGAPTPQFPGHRSHAAL